MMIKNNVVMIIIAIKIIKLELYPTEIKGITFNISPNFTPFRGRFLGYRYTCFNGFNGVKALKGYKALMGYKGSHTSQKSHA